MGTHGILAYKIGRKVRYMQVRSDADILWQLCIREIYVLMKHYGSVELLQQAFARLIDTSKLKPKQTVATEMFAGQHNTDYWYCLLFHCQHSYINILQSGYILNDGAFCNGLTVMLDFNRRELICYENVVTSIYYKNKMEGMTEYHRATIDKIMCYDNMPIKTLTEIVDNMRERYNEYKIAFDTLQKELVSIEDIIAKSFLSNDLTAKLIKSDVETAVQRLQLKYRPLYHRMNDLGLIN